MAKLENAATPDANRIDVIFRRIVSPRGNREVARANLGDRVLNRRADEAEDDFVERAKVEALARTDRRPCCVILLPQQVMQ
ncbi:hypothetical protein E4Q08_09880 [Candidatus Accumulibacter phosphatis]|uniref:Uncharacterized protein n=2 Tax=Candidatus Accumulibacter contiguus TaxID=2954381 RepID=A0ABX1T9D4_9PROT|nr:hypothetical protein [Candidatus Accumulibacter contiguus]